ncbi:MAG: M48 family metallopeptidase [Opitutae bacterium]|nr:M48 family metallopeptidase [Opitutae bacterium]
MRVNEHQLPALHAAFRNVCGDLGVAKPPALYVLQSGGLLNAFALRFSGRDFVVVYSDFLEALGADSPEMKFILGHELGHLKSRHPLKQILLAPGLIFPLIGPAYRRAWESSCDRHGALAAGDIRAAARALLVLGGGPGHGPQLDAAAYARQHHEERGFFVTLHELTSTYPTLSRRVADMLALADGRPAPKPDRDPLAYFIALFMPGGGAQSSPANALVLVVAVGLLAAMAIPAFQKVRQSSQQKVCFNNERQLAAAFDQYLEENGKGAKSWDDITGPDKYVKTMPACPVGGTYSATYHEGSGYEVSCSVHGSYQHPKQQFGSQR